MESAEYLVLGLLVALGHRHEVVLMRSCRGKRCAGKAGTVVVVAISIDNKGDKKVGGS